MPPVIVPANDNCLHDRDTALLGDALRHFAAHGLNATRAALANAEHAQSLDERAKWLAICAMFDRRAAAQRPLRKEVVTPSLQLRTISKDS